MAESVRVLFFASAREATGRSEEMTSCDPEGISERVFWDQLVVRHPALASLRSSMRLARNHEYMDREALICPGDEIALIPPVSGG